MAATATLMLWKYDPTPEGLLPIVLCIKAAGKRKYLWTEFATSPKYWDSKEEKLKDTHANWEEINPILAKKKKDALVVISEKEVTNKRVVAAEVKKRVVAGEVGPGTNIFSFADNYRLEMEKTLDEDTLENNRKHMARLELHHGNRSLTFEEITPEYLLAYNAALVRDEYAPSYIHLLMRSIRRMFQAAKKKQLIKNYPFDEYKLIDPEPGERDRLSLSEVKLLEKNLNEMPVEWHSSIVYALLGCYTGLRISDWKKFDYDKRVGDGWLRVRPKKRGTSWVSMPLPPAIARLAGRLRMAELPVHEAQIRDHINSAMKFLGIKKHITPHCTRHTFAVTMCAERGISVEVCAELMGITVQVCANTYYKVTNVKIEKEVKKAWKGL